MYFQTRKTDDNFFKTTAMGTKEIKQVFTYLESNQGVLTPYQADFIKSLKKYFTWKKNLSSKQIECLLSLKDNINS